ARGPRQARPARRGGWPRTRSASRRSRRRAGRDSSTRRDSWVSTALQQDGQVLYSVQEQVRRPRQLGGVDGQRQAGEAAHERADRGAALQPGQRRAETEVDAVAEAQVTVRA